MTDQEPLDFGDGRPQGAALRIVSTRSEHLLDALASAYAVLGFEAATGGGEVFKALALGRLIEPTSKLDSIRVLDEVGVPTVAYPTIQRRLPVYATDKWRQRLAAACADHVGPGRPPSRVRRDDPQFRNR